MVSLLEYKQHKIHYHQYGNGQALIVAFHGFADNGDLFENVAKVFEKTHTLIAIDMPFHGQTLWEEEVYTPEDINFLVRLIMNQFGAKYCTMMCHSMGGRIILGILPLLTAQIEAIYFFAPAGFQYTFSASRFWCPMWFRKRARDRFEESEGIFRFFEVTHRLKLMNRATYLVFKQQLDIPRRRARLLKTWMAMYYFPMKATNKHINLLNIHKIPTYFFYGKKDRITPARCAQKFIQKLSNTELVVSKGNHFFVRNQLSKRLKEWHIKKRRNLHNPN